jgi:hypothetical protein
MMKHLIIVFCFFCFHYSSALTVKEVLEKMNAVYANKNYSVNVKFDLFKGTSSNVVESSYEGSFIQFNNKVYQKIDKTEFITSPEFCLRISNSESTIELMKGETYKRKDIDFMAILKECKETKIEEKENYYYITLIINNLSQVEFSKVNIKVYKSNFHLAQIDMYYSHFEDFSKNNSVKDLQQPHLRMVYSKFSSKPSISSSIFNFESYFKTEKTIIKPIGAYTNYELIDYRLN